LTYRAAFFGHIPFADPANAIRGSLSMAAANKTSSSTFHARFFTEGSFKLILGRKDKSTLIYGQCILQAKPWR
jgi:hypothetical protein